jgi:hypothetical protein
MARITYFVALPFDVADGRVFVGEPIECPSPVATIERAKGLWKVLGHADSKRRIGIIVNSCSISCRSSRSRFAYRDRR